MDDDYDYFYENGVQYKIKKIKFEKFIPLKREKPKSVLSEREELIQKLAELDSKQYHYSSKKSQKQIRAELMSSNLGRFVK